MIVNINGDFVAPEKAAIAINDGAVLFGDTLFETLKARGKKILFIEEHLDRLEQSAGNLAFPFEQEKVRQALYATVEHLDAPVSRLRLTLSRGPFTGLKFPPAENGHFILTATPYQEPSGQEQSTGVDCVLAPNQRINPLSHLPQMKRGNYTDCLYAANFAREKDAFEAFFITPEKLVLEGATTNIFLIRDRTLITPPAGNLVLAGIMRCRVLNVAPELGLAVEERSILLDELFEAHEVFITNSLIDLVPVSTVDKKPLCRGQWVPKLLQAVTERSKQG